MARRAGEASPRVAEHGSQRSSDTASAGAIASVAPQPTNSPPAAVQTFPPLGAAHVCRLCCLASAVSCLLSPVSRRCHAFAHIAARIDARPDMPLANSSLALKMRMTQELRRLQYSPCYTLGPCAQSHSGGVVPPDLPTRMAVNINIHVRLSIRGTEHPSANNTSS
jgi:hypothetical protein